MRLKGYLLIVISVFCITVFGHDGFKTSSLFKSGSWYKIKIENTGIYKLSYDDLKALGFQAPENIRVYGLDGEQLSAYNEEVTPNDVEELPLYSSNKSNFSSGDYYLFYASGIESRYFDESKQLFKNKIHSYALYNYLYITASFGPGKRIETENTSTLIPNKSTSTYSWFNHYEVEEINLINSGRQWYSSEFINNQFSKEFNIKNINTASPVRLETGLAVRSGGMRVINVKVNGSVLSSQSFTPVDLDNSEGVEAKYRVVTTDFSLSSSLANVNLVFDGSSTTDRAYVDYICLNARCNLKFENNNLFFRDITVVDSGNITTFSISNANNLVQIWRVTEQNSVSHISSTLSGGNLSFIDKTDSLEEYVAVDVQGSFSAPIYVDEEYNDLGWMQKKQNIHGADVPELLIVTHPSFLTQANELAQLHRNKDNMSVAVYTTTEVYNEFSSGKPDAAAIRNMARMFLERSTASDSLRYLLLIGDGSFDNRTINENNPNYIPTVQSEESLDHINSYVSDDFYAFLELGEGEFVGTYDIGVGRLPVNSDGEDEFEAQGVIDKIKVYYQAENMRDWRNNFVFLGDDGESGWDDIIFMEDSDELADIVEELAPSMNINKIYMDAYEQTSSSTGASYPEVEIELDNAFNRGALVFNYMGHGGENGITQEQVLTTSDFANMTNAPYFPLFVTATCQLSRYDNVVIEGANYSKKVSAGETALLNPDGGAIAMLTTTRVVYQSSNRLLSKTLYQNLFKKHIDGTPYRLGDVIRVAKNKTLASRSNFLKFALLGDPAITLAHGEYIVIADSVNGKSVEETDTLSALSEISVCGFVAYDDSTLINDFNGVVYLSIFDKAYDVTSNGNDGTATFDFSLQDKRLFRGKATVENGRFKLKFIVPKDISYSFGEGKMSFYAENGLIDAKGACKQIIIGGTSSDFESDAEGPKIQLFMNDTNFVDGGITNSSPVLIANVYDKKGVNTTGNGIGHDITGVLDDDLSRIYLMNDYFEGALDDYQRGELAYPLSDIEPGQHYMNVKVWDTYNNSSESSLNFYVTKTDDLLISDLLNYPNPARNYTSFQYSHNLPNEEHEIEISIYDVTGRVVQKINRTLEETGFVSTPLVWDISGSNAIQPGIYPYRIIVSTSDGYEGIQSGRLIIIP